MLERDRQDRFAERGERLLTDAMEVEPRQHAERQVIGAVLERIAERTADDRFNLLGAIRGQRMPEEAWKRSQVVEAVEVVDVVVSEGDSVHEADLLPQQLQAHLRRGVDQQVAARKLEEHGAS